LHADAVVIPVSLLYLPTWQYLHVVAAGTLPYLPTPHAVHLWHEISMLA
jgi:hypothetical protein